MVGNIILGTTKNKLGDVVFSRKKGQTTGRVRSRKIKNPQTDAQAANRARMAPLIADFRALNGVLYSRLKFGRTQYNQFISNNLKELRPTSLGTGVPAIYETRFPFLIPPTPKEGAGAGLPTPIPLIVTKGIYTEPRYGVGITSTPATIVQGKNTAIYNGVGYAPDTQFRIGKENINELIKKALANEGITINKGVAYTITLNAKQCENIANELITGSRKIKTGFLAYFFKKEGGMLEAKYCEISSMDRGYGTIAISSSGNLNSSGFDITNSNGDKFRIFTNATVSAIAVIVDNFHAVSGIPINMNTAIILSQRINGKLQVSTSKLMLTIDVNDVAYQSLFTQESIDNATKDYQKITTETNETNLSLKVD